MLKRHVLLMSVLMMVFVLATSTAAHAQDGTAKNPITPIKDYLIYLTNGGNFSGTVLIAQGDDILLNEAYGMANREWDVRNTPDGKFRIAAITKQFTAIAILMLQEQGKLKLEDPICAYLKDCPVAWADITIEQLLTQSDGIPALFNDPHDPLMTQMIEPNQLMSMLMSKPLAFKAGTQWADGDSGYIVLGQIIADVSGKSYQDFLRDTIFKPLGMANTGYDDPKQIIKQHVTGYVNRQTAADDANPDILYSAGALYSTTNDLFRWTQAVFHGKVLSTKTLDTLLDKLKGYSDVKGTRYGFEIATDQGHRYVRTEGNFPGFKSVVYYYLDDDVTVVVLGNIETARPSELVETIFRFIFKVA